MKKKVLSIFLALVMVLCIAPMAAFAEGASTEPTESSGELLLPEESAEEKAGAAAVQALIDALPDADSINERNMEDVMNQLEAIDDAKLLISDEEENSIDYTRYDAAAAVLQALMSGAETGLKSTPMEATTSPDDAEIIWTEVSTAAALLAAFENGGNYKLTDNIDIPAGPTTLYIQISKNINLDLNGKKVEFFVTSVISISGALTVSDSKNNGRIIIPNSQGLYIESGGSFTLNSGSMKIWWEAIYVTNGTFTMNGGVLNGKVNNGSSGLFYLNGGVIDLEKEQAIYNSGTLYANGGTVSSGNNVIAGVNNRGKLATEENNTGTVFDCTFGNSPEAITGGGIFKGAVVNYGTHYQFGYKAARITGGTYNGAVENRGIISGGTFNGTVINASSYVDGYGVTVECQSIISGGTFNGTVTNNGTITGGTFTGTVKNNGLIYATANNTGSGSITYDKTAGHVITYKIGENKYAEQFVKTDSTAAKPSIDPKQVGKIFAGWYKEGTPTTWVKFPLKVIEGDPTLYAWLDTCYHIDSTAKATCTDGATCTVCSGTIEKLGHYLEKEGNIWKCTREGCDHTVAETDAPTIEIVGAGKVHDNQDYTFSFDVPENFALASISYNFKIRGSNLIHEQDRNTYSATLKSKYYVSGESSFDICVKVKNDDGDTFRVYKVVTILAEHEGGTATCNEKAICDACLEPYGEENPNNHANLKQFPAKAATTTEAGNVEYWYCDGCQKYFRDADATTDFPDGIDGVLIPKLPVIIKGDGQTVTVGEKKALAFTSDADYAAFVRVLVDGKELPDANYTVQSGSTTVTLKAEYVATLSAGEHTLGIVSENGTATAKFTVNKKAAATTTPTTTDSTKSPQTGESSNIIFWISLLCISVIAVVVTTLVRWAKQYCR